MNHLKQIIPDSLNGDLERNYEACSSLERKLFGEVEENPTLDKDNACVGYLVDAQALIRTYEQRIHYLQCLKACVDFSPKKL